MKNIIIAGSIALITIISALSSRINSAVDLENLLINIIASLILGLPILLIVWLIGKKLGKQTKIVFQIVGVGLFIGTSFLVFTSEDVETHGIEFEESSHIDYCDSPYTISLGFLDPRYNLFKSDAKDYILEAERKWEDGTGLNLLTYIESASTSDIVVDFIYDERQKKVEETRRYERIRIQYEADLSNFNKRVTVHNSLTMSHDSLLAQYERMVEEWNNDPRYLQTRERHEELEKFRVLLNNSSDQINTSLVTLNSEEQALKVREKTLNSMYKNLEGGSEEEHFIGFFDGGRVISIYQYSNSKELVNTLTHEIGHALGLGHVSDTKSTMHATSGPDQVLTEHDLGMVRAFCGL